jgi:2,3-bisphosphoglycerate-dependent phosphoglycerate mutase
VTIQLVLVRHGEAVCNVQGFYGGEKSCKGLTNRGKGQAIMLGDFCARVASLRDPAVALYSPLRRARETAFLTLRALQPTRIQMHRGLRELDCGLADGLSREEARRRFGQHAGAAADPYIRIAPGAESWAEMIERASGALEDIVRAAPPGVIVAFTHLGVIRASLSAFSGWPVDRPLEEKKVPWASITAWTWGPNSAPCLEVLGGDFASHSGRRSAQ